MVLVVAGGPGVRAAAVVALAAGAVVVVLAVVVPGFGGGFGGGGGSTGKRYNLSLGVQILNLFNNLDLSTPNGVLTSQQFESIDTACGTAVD